MEIVREANRDILCYIDSESYKRGTRKGPADFKEGDYRLLSFEEHEAHLIKNVTRIEEAKEMEENQLLAVESNIDRMGKPYLSFIHSLEELKVVEERFETLREKGKNQFSLSLPALPSDMSVSRDDIDKDKRDMASALESFHLMFAGLDCQKFTKDNLAIKIAA